MVGQRIALLACAGLRFEIDDDVACWQRAIHGAQFTLVGYQHVDMIVEEIDTAAAVKGHARARTATVPKR